MKLKSLILPIVLVGSLFMSPPINGGDILVIINNQLVTADAVVDPKVEIVGDESPAEPGELVFLKVDVKDSASSYIKAIKNEWAFSANGRTKGHFMDAAGNAVVGAGVTNGAKISVIVKSSLTYQVGDKTVVKEVSGNGEITVGTSPNPGPNPDPNPNPNPNPDVKIPDGFKGATKTVANAFRLVNVPKRKEIGQAFSANYAQVAARVAAGTLTGKNGDEFLTNVFSELKRLNRETLAKFSTTETPFAQVSEAAKALIYNLYITNALKDMSEYAELLRALGEGFNYG